MTDLVLQFFCCHCEEPRRGDAAIFWQFVTGICKLVRITGSLRLPRLLRSLAMTDLAVQSLFCHCEEPRRGDVAISWQFVTGICRLVRLTGSRGLPRLLRSLAMTDLVVQSFCCHCEEPRRGDVAIFWQFVTGICRLVRLTGSRGLPRLLRSLAMTDLVVQSFCCHCEEPRRGDAAISWQFVAGICRLVRITGSPRLPRPTTSLRAPSQ